MVVNAYRAGMSVGGIVVVVVGRRWGQRSNHADAYIGLRVRGGDPDHSIFVPWLGAFVQLFQPLAFSSTNCTLSLGTIRWIYP